MSELQRVQAMQGYVSANFKSDEQLRVRSLLNLPGGLAP